MSGDTEIVLPSPSMTPRDFGNFALDKVKSGNGYLVFKKVIGSRTIVLRIGPSGYGSYTASLQMRQGRSDYPEPGGELKDLTPEAGCELYAWLRTHEDCDTMQKALVSPNGQALALCALFRTLALMASLRPDVREVKETPKEITA